LQYERLPQVVHAGVAATCATLMRYVMRVVLLLRAFEEQARRSPQA